jgi:hypothetical protein
LVSAPVALLMATFENTKVFVTDIVVGS